LLEYYCPFQLEILNLSIALAVIDKKVNSTDKLEDLLKVNQGVEED